ncbi:homeotic protein spalt-major isoform X2 [Cryptotermes secundus]|uniref:homeotic protein spalt-major isoform X2 n=1 Tax=Cryptotermes secundus TaxID=105785 RepID=UPI000CD7CAC1|nr:homeotic protein spalt-major isoform X2 [Cryptotermes secundus]
MSRRKQARPLRHLESEDGLVSSLPNGESSGSGSEEEGEGSGGGDSESARRPSRDEHMCGHCQAEFLDLSEFIEHRKDCDRKALVLGLTEEPPSSDPEDMMATGDEDEEDGASREGGKRLEEERRQRQDAENNNSGEGETEGENDMQESDMPLGFPFPLPPVPAAGHVTLEALQNTKVAVAQFAATAMANNADNTAALQELAVLQSTLFTLQHQQVMQMSLIQQLQHQLQITRSKEGSPVSPPPQLPPVLPVPAQQSPPKSSRPSTPVKQDPPPQPPTTQSVPASHPQQQQKQSASQQQQQPQLQSQQPSVQQLPSHLPSTTPKPLTTPRPPTTSPPVHASPLPLCSISSSLAASIITNPDPPPLNEPNTLEMLQRRAQEVLENASQGLLANNLADELAFRKSGCKSNSLSPYDSKSGGRNEPFFKHRCRYCGKVFGSDSALQIHIRSHTGERPFKCNVCGSRFTTKGNLKVHFQRHTAKFPHIKMNPNPVPEHLDKYHPPLLAQMGSHQSISPGIPPHPHHPPPPHPFHASTSFPSTALPLYRPPPPHDLIPHHLHPPPHRQPHEPPPPPQPHSKPLLPHPALFGQRMEQDVPENLSKPPSLPSSHSSPPPDQYKKEPLGDEAEEPSERERLNSEDGGADRLSPKQEPVTDHEHELEADMEMEHYSSPPPYDDCSLDSKYSNEDMLMGDADSPIIDKNEESLQEQPENLSSKSATGSGQLSMSVGQRLPPSIPFPHAVSPPSSTSSGSINTLHTPIGPIPLPNDLDPAKDPAIYTNLLPRPGSNDNSWESLIEVTKTSETSKLQQLVDNIEHKLTDPNQCVICHRVLSCKSALQMHYRTHTGERPFKCKICGRAFTTKGNLKTHMGVHRAKPPMRVLHQCPVCHKKFTNALVLQQHIRLHTGEPTDLTPEQIQAAEIKEYPPPAAFPLPNSMSPFLAQGFPLPGMSPLPPPGLHLGLKPDFEEKRDRDRDKDRECEREEKEDFSNKADFLDDDNTNSSGLQQLPSFSTSLAALENQVRTITTMASQLSASGLSRSAEELCNNNSTATTNKTSTPTPMNGEKSPGPGVSPTESEIRASPSPPQPPTPIQIPRPPSSQQPESPAASESNSLGALDLTPRASGPGQITPAGLSPGVFSGFGLLPPSSISTGSSPLMTSALSSLTSSVLTSTAFSPIGLAVGPAVRPGNTTCNICYKTFACNSALEIHYRSHTKERPFKCTVCDRGFSTKGNMKQHMLTHKIRDMPSHLFETSKPPPPPVSTPNNDEGSNTEDMRTSSLESPLKSDLGMKRSPPEGEAVLPIPKRQPGLPKHLCHVCNKNFSSSSALQIHMRTHTGDKPFRCTICQKAFTTKGNLKVHMGTHMWSNGASRRGRRMSLDLPPIPMTPKDSEFLQRRPDLFYPYLPAPFLNGMQQKLNEISVIQSVNSNNGTGLSPPGGKYASLLGFGGYSGSDRPIISEPPQSQPNSPLSDKPLSSPPPLSLSLGSHHDSPPLCESGGNDCPDREAVSRRMWDLHYDRKASGGDNDEPVGTSPSPPGHATPHPPTASRGEGLAA